MKQIPSRPLFSAYSVSSAQTRTLPRCHRTSVATTTECFSAESQPRLISAEQSQVRESHLRPQFNSLGRGTHGRRPKLGFDSIGRQHGRRVASAISNAGSDSGAPTPPCRLVCFTLLTWYFHININFFLPFVRHAHCVM